MGILRVTKRIKAPTRCKPKLFSTAASTSSGKEFKDGESVSTVVIGGGATGAGVLYHLAKAGMGDAIMLEKGELTCGSTWHAAGLCTYFHGGSNMRNIHYYSCEFYDELAKETGLPVSFQRPGSIRLIENDPDRIDEAHYQLGKAKLYPGPLELITPQEIKNLHPLINLDAGKGIWGGILSHNDGHIDPTSLTNALVAGAKNHGCKVFQKTPCEGLELRADGRWEVFTAKGKILADRIVNAGGLWADKIAAMAGVYHPLAIIEHQYVITETIPEVNKYWKENGKQLPVLRSLEGSYYVRQERDGLLVGPYESKTAMNMHDVWNDKPWGSPLAPMDFGHDLFPEDLERIMPHLEHCSELLPVFGEAGIGQTINGPVSWPPDGNPLLGPVHDVPNYWAACGMSYGIAHAGGAGKYLVDWIVTGEPPYELFESDPARYGQWAGKKYTDLKVRETYGKNNDVSYPKEDRPEGRPLRRNAIWTHLNAAGAQWGFHNGLEQPLWFAKTPGEHYEPSFRRTNWFEPVRQEVQAVANHAGVYDASSFSKFMISGPGATEYLDTMIANKLPNVGKVGIGHMITPNGRIMAELTLARLNEDTYYIITGSDMERHDLRWLQMNNIPETVMVTNITQSWSVLAFAGPASTGVLEKLCAEEVDKVPFFGILDTEVCGVPCILMRLSYTGLQPGWELHCQGEYFLNLYEGVKKQDPKIVDFGAFALDSFRLEAGFKGLGGDMRKDNPAMSAGIKRFVKFKKKADWIGKDALLKEKADPPSHTIVKMTIETDVEAYNDNPIYTAKEGGELVGWTSSGGYGFLSDKSLAIGYLSNGYDAVGKEIWVEVLGERKKGNVTHAPLL